MSQNFAYFWTFFPIVHWWYFYQDRIQRPPIAQSVRNWAINSHNGQARCSFNQKNQISLLECDINFHQKYTCKLQVPMLDLYKCIVESIDPSPTIIDGGLWNAWWHYHGFRSWNSHPRVFRHGWWNLAAQRKLIMYHHRLTTKEFKNLPNELKKLFISNQKY